MVRRQATHMHIRPTCFMLAIEVGQYCSAENIMPFGVIVSSESDINILVAYSERRRPLKLIKSIKGSVYRRILGCSREH